MRPSALLRAPGPRGHLPGSASHCSPLRRLHRQDLGEPGRVRRPGGRGAAEAKTPSGAWANNCPKPGGALQGLRTRGVTFQGRWRPRRAQLRVQKNRRSWGEELPALRLPLGCLKGRLPPPALPIGENSEPQANPRPVPKLRFQSRELLL